MTASAPRKRWTDRDAERIIAVILRAGVSLSSAVVSLGAVVYLGRHPREPVDYRVFRGEPTDLRTLGGVVRDALALHGRGILQLGVVLLILTPVLRVAFSILAFATERDWMYVAFTTTVLAILLYSLLGPYV